MAPLAPSMAAMRSIQTNVGWSAMEAPPDAVAFAAQSWFTYAVAPWNGLATRAALAGPAPPTRTNPAASVNAAAAANARRGRDLRDTALSASAAMQRCRRSLNASRRGWDFMRGFLLAG